jgi:hypothetical protein
MAYYQRRLPHWHPKGRDIFITWRLEGTLPKARFVPPAGLTTGQAFVYIDRLLDNASCGPCWMRRPEVAQSVVGGLLYAANTLKHYELHAYVVMPNHVHMLITPLEPVPKINRRTLFLVEPATLSGSVNPTTIGLAKENSIGSGGTSN